MNVPAVVYLWDGFLIVPFCQISSPNDQFQVVGLPAEVSVNLTDNGVPPILGVAVKSGIGSTGDGVGSGEGVGDGVGSGEGVGDGVGSGEGVGDGVGSGDGVGAGVVSGEGVGDGGGSGDGEGNGVGVGEGVGDGVGSGSPHTAGSWVTSRNTGFVMDSDELKVNP